MKAADGRHARTRGGIANVASGESGAPEAWYSAAVLIRVTIAGACDMDTRSVFVFRAVARDWEAARRRATDIGRAAEDSYPNPDGEQVEWRLLEVETLDMLGTELVDGREVWWEPLPCDESAGTTAPEDHVPGQTGV